MSIELYMETVQQNSIAIHKFTEAVLYRFTTDYCYHPVISYN